jgi:hypothetical protein
MLLLSFHPPGNQVLDLFLISRGFLFHGYPVFGGCPSGSCSAPKGLTAKNRKIIVDMGSMTGGYWKAISGECLVKVDIAAGLS